MPVEHIKIELYFGVKHESGTLMEFEVEEPHPPLFDQLDTATLLSEELQLDGQKLVAGHLHAEVLAHYARYVMQRIGRELTNDRR